MTPGRPQCESWRVAEGESRVTIAASIIAGELDIGPMLDGKNAPEWVPAEVCDQAACVIRGVGRIGEHYIEGARGKPFGEANGIGPVHRHGIRNAQGGNVLLQRTD